MYNFLLLSTDGTCDLFLTIEYDRVEWGGIPLICLQYVRCSLRRRESFDGLEETHCCDVSCLWWELQGRELREASRSEKRWAYSHRESEFYKQPLEFGRWLWAPWKSYPSWHFDDSLEQGTQLSCVQTPDPLKLWSENVCYFQVLNVWWFVTQ